MSGARGCRNPEHRPHWRVLHREHNHSAFGGYRRVPSAWSEVTCDVCVMARDLPPGQSGVWRTMAGYVRTLPGECSS